jgi:hypothetical protein
LFDWQGHDKIIIISVCIHDYRLESAEVRTLSSKVQQTFQAKAKMAVPPSRVASYISRPFQDSNNQSQTKETSCTQQKLSNKRVEITCGELTKSGVEKESSPRSIALHRSQRQSHLLVAILKNDAANVQAFLQEEKQKESCNNPSQLKSVNFMFSIGRGEEVSIISMDHVFAMKKVMGDTPTALHLAILNLYFRCTCGGGKQTLLPRFLMPYRGRIEADKARLIINLLMQHMDWAQNQSPMRFSVVNTKDSTSTVEDLTVVSPFGLLQRMDQLAKSLKWKKMEATIRLVMDDICECQNESKQSMEEARDDQVETHQLTTNGDTESGKKMERTQPKESVDAINRETLDEICQLIFGSFGGKTGRGDRNNTPGTSATYAGGFDLFLNDHHE